jgi:hypothetical protein
LVVVVFVASAIGYLLVPSAMLGIVGMDSNPHRVPGRHGAGTARRAA